MAEAVKSPPVRVRRAASQDLGLSLACPYIHSHSFPKGSHQLLRVQLHDSVGAAFLASFFFQLSHSQNHLGADTEYVYFFPGAHHPKATTLGKSPFIQDFLACFYTSSVSR